ncbi:MAG: hypothetical protein J6J18_08905 [Oscillospiraceae bacterium]|nr:hypothetical protein [Oscillospiraceae bacterium]
MLHADHPNIRGLLLQGNFGLERESLRIDGDGFLAHTSHPFPDDKHIVRDFCENQTEINTPVTKSAHEAVQSLLEFDRQIQKTLKRLPKREYLWPFSNPPYIRSEQDIPVARFYGEQASKTEYREYLSDRYGRYKMTFSGIHVNYSFDEALLREDFALSGEADFDEYRNQLYVALAEKAAAYGWLLVAVTAASPLMDSSFVEKGKFDTDTFNGLASTRCSELGYWNYFAPIFNYSNIRDYADSIQHYVDEGLLRFPTELYYPIRLKPRGVNKLSTLREQGVDHIELRMFDLNPLVPGGIEERDLSFAQLFLVWLASTPREELSVKAQVQAVQNFKNAAHYDLKTVKIVPPDGEVNSVANAALKVLDRMEEFYQDFPAPVREVLDFEREKFVDGDNRYAWKLRRAYDGGFVKKGMELARQRQEEADV